MTQQEYSAMVDRLTEQAKALDSVSPSLAMAHRNAARSILKLGLQVHKPDPSRHGL